MAAGERLGAQLRLGRLARLFALSARELEILLICLAPEIDLRYERLFSYLQDDVTRKRPSVDLVLNLLSQTLAEKIANRTHLAPTAALVRHQLIVLFDDAAQPQPTLLARYLRVDPRIVDFLLAGEAEMGAVEAGDLVPGRRRRIARPSTSGSQHLRTAALPLMTWIPWRCRSTAPKRCGGCSSAAAAKVAAMTATRW